MNRGRFIVLEGIDGSGLTTQTHCLQQSLSALGQPVLLSKEPTPGPAGTLIRQALGGHLALQETSVGLLFAADRLEHLHHTVVPALHQGIDVICDRNYLSSLAYQSLQVPEDWLRDLNRFCLLPDVTLFIDVPVTEAVRRLEGRAAALEVYEKASTLTAIRTNFLRLLDELTASGERVLVVNGVGDIEQVAERINQSLAPFWEQPLLPLRTLGRCSDG